MLGRVLLFFSLFLGAALGSCPSGAVEWKTNCYFFNSTASGYARAESACIRRGGHLASIHDGFTNDVIGQNAPDYFNIGTVPDFWIGINDLTTPGTWEWTDGSTVDYIDWSRGQPGNKTGLDCGALSMASGLWMASDCFKAKPYVCAVPNLPPTTTTRAAPTTTTKMQMPSTITTRRIPSTTAGSGKCPSGWTYFAQSNSCYLISMGLQSVFQSAEAYCQTMGAHVPSIHSLAELAFLNDYVIKNCHAIWLGLQTFDNGTTWQWNDGTPLDYVSWRFNTPPTQSATLICTFLSDNSCGDGANDGFFDPFDCQSNWGATVCKKSVM